MTDNTTDLEKMIAYNSGDKLLEKQTTSRGSEPMILEVFGDRFEIDFGYYGENTDMPTVAIISQVIKYPGSSDETIIMHTVPMEEFIRDAVISAHKKEIARLTRQLKNSQSGEKS